MTNEIKKLIVGNVILILSIADHFLNFKYSFLVR